MHTTKLMNFKSGHKKANLVNFTGYRSVPLKNGFSENLELASLLVYVDIQQVEVKLDFFIFIVNVCLCCFVNVLFWIEIEMNIWYLTSESTRGTLLLLKAIAKEAYRLRQWILPLRHSLKPSAHHSASSPRWTLAGVCHVLWQEVCWK